MATTRTQHVEGLSDCMAAFDALPKALQRRTLTRIGTQALEPMAEEARRLAPDDPRTSPPDDLHGGITVSARQRGGRATQEAKDGETSVTVYMGPTKAGYPQAIPQEFGSVKMPPHPYMRPAYEKFKEAAIRFVAARFAEAVHATAKRFEARARRLARNRTSGKV